MKVTKTNNDELYITRGGYSTLLVGGMLAIGGLLGLLVALHAAGQGGVIGRVAAGAAMVGGMIGLLLASKREVFLRHGGVSEVRTTNVLFHKMKSVTFAADQIVAVGFETHDEYSGAAASGNGVQTRNRESSMWLMLRDTTEIPLFSVTRAANSGVSVGGIRLSGMGRAPLYNEATMIADFFGVPLQSRSATQSLPTNLGIFADSARRMMQGPANQPVAPIVAPMQNAAPPQAAPFVAPESAVAGPVDSAPVSVLPSTAPQSLPVIPVSSARIEVQVPPRSPEA